jgi:methyl-accepting chemotaxis protein
MSISQKILVISCLMVCAILSLAVLSLRTSAQLGESGLGLYDKAFVGVHYAQTAQTLFTKVEARSPQLPLTSDDDLEALNKAVDTLDVAVDRASTDRERTQAIALRRSLKALADPAADARPTLAAVSKQFRRLVQRYADDAFERRNQTESLIADSNRQLIAISAASVGVALVLATVLILSVARPLKRVIRWIEAHQQSKLWRGAEARRDEIGAVVRAITARSKVEEQLQQERELRQESEIARAQQEQQQRAAAAAVAVQTAETQLRVISALSDRLHRLANNQLNVGIYEAFPHEFEALRRDFNDAVAHLEDVFSDIRETSEKVAQAASEISSGASALAQRTERQAAKLETTVSLHAQITRRLSKSLDASRMSAELIGGARTRAESSRTVVGEAVDAIKGIEKSSREIGQIIGVIDEIAFQTNLLALNAGVEAARAGDAGRGFAVVAQEVRALAQRSADAAKQIKDLVIRSTGAVARGVELVDATGTALNAIANEVTEVSELVQELAGVAEAQAHDLEGANQAVVELEAFTQQNAQVAEQSASACVNLQNDSGRLREVVAQFVISNTAAAA